MPSWISHLVFHCSLSISENKYKLRKKNLSKMLINCTKNTNILLKKSGKITVCSKSKFNKHRHNNYYCKLKENTCHFYIAGINMSIFDRQKYKLLHLEVFFSLFAFPMLINELKKLQFMLSFLSIPYLVNSNFSQRCRIPIIFTQISCTYHL